MDEGRLILPTAPFKAHNGGANEQIQPSAYREAPFGDFFGASPFPTLVSQGGIIVYANPAAIALLRGHAPADVIGRSELGHLHRTHASAAASECERALRTGETSRSREELWIRVDGSTLPVEVTRWPVSSGSTAALITKFVDTTARAEQGRRRFAEDGELLLLVEASSALLTTTNSPAIVESVVELAQRFVRADAYAVWRAEETEWRPASSKGLSDDYIAEAHASGRASQVLSERYLLVEDTWNDARSEARRQQHQKEGIRSMMVIPLRISGEAAGTLVFYWRTPHSFSEEEIRLALALGNLAAAALGAAELYEGQMRLRDSALRSERRTSFLAQSGEALASSLDFQSTLTTVAELAVPGFADWAAVDLVGESGEMLRVAVRHSDPDQIAFAYEVAKKYPPRPDDPSRVAVKTGKAILIEEIPDALIEERAIDEEHARLIRRLGLESLIVAPMVSKDRTLGTVTFATAESGRKLGQSDLLIAEELARRAAIALENASLFTESLKVRNDLEAANAQLRAANADLEQFAYSASHDLRQPLRMVSLYCELLQSEYSSVLDERARGFLFFAQDGARRMAALLEDLLAYTQVVGEHEGPLEPVRTELALNAALENLSAVINESGAVVERVGPFPELPVKPVHVLLLFQNIIGNAIKYRSDATPKISISAERTSKEWRFCIGDNGIGIPPEFATQIFRVFKRLHTSDQYEGTGVGLAICQKIVERYGGRIWVESEEEGRGSQFYFTFPV